MYFTADLHIHSRFSRATAKTLNFKSLYTAAREKGITVVGTGDFTHPAWFEEIREQLEPAEPGLFRLRQELESECEESICVKERLPVRFMLSCEISNIYKKNGITRKTHNLVFLPDLDQTARFNSRLEQIGNIRSDGRPILGLDSRDLLEILLETSEEGFLIPAHIWTPWFSMLGSKSGFDSIEECFEDLTPHIFAVETGLSSDPPMNWRVGDLDGLTLVSNSDAHSPANLAREANLFDTELSYTAIKEALQTGDPEAFLGTIEFFPQEGKYHQDGHRKCGINMHPKQAISHNCICPVCGHPMTLGVLHRVEELATREEGGKPEKTHPYYSVVPLPEMLSELLGCGPKSKKVQVCYRNVLESLGPEIHILNSMPADEIDKAGIPLLAESVSRMREGKVHIFPGFDGQYGEIKVFTPQELDRLSGQQTLFKSTSKDTGEEKNKKPEKTGGKESRMPGASARDAKSSAVEEDSDILAGLNTEQKQAVLHGDGPMMIVAGPGTGKTRTLTCRIARLIKTGRAEPGQVLALTFTNKAALEMTERLSCLLGGKEHAPWAATFHSFCSSFLKQTGVSGDFSIIDDYDRTRIIKKTLERVKNRLDCRGVRHDKILNSIVAAKQQILEPEDDLTPAAGELAPELLAALYREYQELLKSRGLCDYEDLIFKVIGALETDSGAADQYRERFPFIFVDEYQDLNYGQYRIIKSLTSPESSICVIGDPDQSIYGFRGSDVRFFRRFESDYPGAARFRLTKNYRSSETILEASRQVIKDHALGSEGGSLHSGIKGPEAVYLLSAQSERAEAVAIGKTIEEMIGGTGLYYDDFGGSEGARQGTYHAFSDFAVLFRTRSQADVIAETFEQAGIPFQTASKESLWRRRGVQQALACLKVLEGCGSYLDLEECIKTIIPGINAEEINEITDWGLSNRLSLNGLMAEAERNAAEGLSSKASARLQAFLERLSEYSRSLSGLEVPEKISRLEKQPEIREACGSGSDTKEAFRQAVSAAEPFRDNAVAFLESAVLQSDQDIYDNRFQKVALLTLHSAKGLEFPVVFIAGCEDGLIPLNSGAKPSDPEEERRLFYVAMTRAEKMLFLTRAEKRQVYGRTEKRRASPFLEDIESRLLAEKSYGPKPGKKAQKQLNLF